VKHHRWTENAREVLKERYFLKGPDGTPRENEEQLLRRVAGAVAKAEESSRKEREWSERFFKLMNEGVFLPNSPTLMNAGKPEGQLAACFVIPIGDDLDSIFDALKYAARIHQSGGGTGFSFSSLRGKGDEVASSGGVAGGPVSFLRIFDQSTETIKQGGVRRGANMGVLRVDHPDIFEFIESKGDLGSITNFNLSVGVTDEFFRALKKDELFSLRCPRTRKTLRQVKASELFSRLVDSAWKCGDPGLVFLDRMNFFNPTPGVGQFEATNPCGEQPLLGYESCNLGSLNLGRFVQKGALDWEGLGAATREALRFLDNVIDVNHYPLPECRKITRRNRKVGLGVMGYADLLLLLDIPYGSVRALELGEQVMSFIDRTAKSASIALAQERGAFTGFASSLWARLGYPPLRNSTVSTVAPTGTISLLLGASSGIEPHFAANLQRNVLGGRVLVELQPGVDEALRARGVMSRPLSEGAVAQALEPVWRPARVLSPEEHIHTQAVFQRHSDSAVSKTVNLPKEAKPEEVARVFRLAEELGCKGVTVYRDQSRPTQVLEEAPPSAQCDRCVD
jgi:ribonucleoside-diphosphate reductase alpha chain